VLQEVEWRTPWKQRIHAMLPKSVRQPLQRPLVLPQVFPQQRWQQQAPL